MVFYVLLAYAIIITLLLPTVFTPLSLVLEQRLKESLHWEMRACKKRFSHRVDRVGEFPFGHGSFGWADNDTATTRQLWFRTCPTPALLLAFIPQKPSGVYKDPHNKESTLWSKLRGKKNPSLFPSCSLCTNSHSFIILAVSFFCSLTPDCATWPGSLVEPMHLLWRRSCENDAGGPKRFLQRPRKQPQQRCSGWEAHFVCFSAL